MDFKFPTKRGWTVLTFAALAMAAGSAFSQSAEYRRGYDQGYRDGAEAASSQGRPGGMRRISIVEASYGTRDASCDVRDAIQQTAFRRRHLDVMVNNDLCGDPAPHRVKRLSIIYRCGDGPEQRAVGREGSVLSISCR